MKLRLKQMRTERGLTVAQLGEMAGIAASYVSALENHKRPPNARTLEALARALKVEPLDLVDDPRLTAEIQAHLEIMQRLTPEDRAAVIRHARGLASE